MKEQAKVFKHDLDIARAIMGRNVEVTKNYMYVDRYPMFKFFYDHYYTDCLDCREFIDEIYLHVMTPGKRTGRSPLSGFRGESSLGTWLRNVSYTFCCDKKNRKINTVSIDEPDPSGMRTAPNDMDRFIGDVSIDMSALGRMDEETIIRAVLGRMPNKRYSRIMSLRLLDRKPHAEIARIMGMTMGNYYNRRKLAKTQFEEIMQTLSL